MEDYLKQLDEPTRRSILANAAKTFLGVGLLSPFAGSAPAMAASSSGGRKAKHLIYLYMGGGMTHLDTFDPKPGTEVQGPVEPIKTNVEGIRISEYLPNLAKKMDKMAIVRSLNSKVGAHSRAHYKMLTSYSPRGTIRHPTMGSWLLKHKGRMNENLPGNVLVSGPSQHPGAGFMNMRLQPVRIGSPNKGLQHAKLPKGVEPQQFNRRLAMIERFDKDFRQRYKHANVQAYSDFYDDATRLMKSKDLLAFDLGREKSEMRDAYGRNHFGQGCLLARRLVEHGVRAVEVNYGGWDTHSDNFDNVPGRAGNLDKALSTLMSDLESKGLLKDTLIVVATEFGRTPKINDRLGRDHHPRCFSGVLAGGGIKNGVVYGKSDEKAYAPAEDGVSVPDFNATIGAALDLPLNKRVYSKSGRPFTVADKGSPVEDLLA